MMQGTLKHIFTQIALAIAFCARATAQEISEGDIEGRWLTENRQAVAEIKRCGAEMCGSFSWMIGGPRSVGKDGQPLCGRTFIFGLKQEEEGDCWEKGTVYDPQKDKSFALKSVCRSGSDKIEVTGSLSQWLPGISQGWSRVPEGHLAYPDCRVSP